MFIPMQFDGLVVYSAFCCVWSPQVWATIVKFLGMMWRKGTFSFLLGCSKRDTWDPTKEKVQEKLEAPHISHTVLAIQLPPFDANSFTQKLACA